MHQTEKKKSWCTSRGPHVLKLANVMTNPCLMWPHYISYVINYVHNHQCSDQRSKASGQFDSFAPSRVFLIDIRFARWPS